MSLEKIRDDIDKLDRKLVELLRARMDLAIKSKKYKKEIEDLDRERQVLNNLKLLAQKYNLDSNYIMSIYQLIFEEGKKQQKG
jgi:chorismate mutase